MRNRTRVIAVVAAVTAVVAAGSSAAAVASATDAHGHTASATKKPGPPSEQQANDALVAAVAKELHLSEARVNAALAPLFAAGRADTSSPVFAAAARSLGVSPEQLNAALVQAKQSLAGALQTTRGPVDKKAGGPSEQQANDAMVAVVARVLHLSVAQVSAALAPLFAAGRADTSSPVLAAAARSLGVSPEQLNAALVQAKQSLAGGS